MPETPTGWNANTLKVYVDQRFDDMNARVSAALVDAQHATEKLDLEVTRRFDGMDKNFDRLFSRVNDLQGTLNERGGGLSLIKTAVPSIIALASVIAVIVVGTGH